MSLKEAKAFFTKNKTTNTAFGYGHPKKDFIPGLNMSCYSGMTMPKGYTKLYVALRVVPTADAELRQMAVDYWEYVLGPYSPWRTALKNTKIFLDSAGYPMGFETDGDVPLYTLFSVCLACRTPKESYDKLRSFFDLQDAGFGRIEALYLSSLLSYSNSMYRWSPYGNHGFPFHPCSLSYKKLLSKQPDEPTKDLFTSGKSGLSCNKIWNGEKNSFQVAPDLLKQKPKYQGVFPAFKKPYEDNPDNGLKQGKELYKALREWKETWGET